MSSIRNCLYWLDKGYALRDALALAGIERWHLAAAGVAMAMLAAGLAALVVVAA